VRSGAEVVTRIGVANVEVERDRPAGLRIDVGTVHRVEGVISHVDFADDDGNALSLYTEL